MKKIILSILILFTAKIFGQATYTDQAGKWRLGVNAGAMWQASDVTAHAGIAGGFTIEKILNKKADALVGFTLGLRYLSGNSTGLDTKPSYGVANNTALNGSFDSTTNYAKHGGVFYNNYKTYIHEGALELKINFPRFEQKTNLIFHIMGGIGVCNYKTWINALDVNGNMYDFTSLQNAQNVTSADVKKVLNGSYGTLAQGSSSNGTTRLTPSVGVGFGFKLSRVIALVFEYRASFPGTNLLDGVTHDMNNELIKNNDFYNYVSANLLFTIYGRQHKSSYNTPPAYTNATPNYTAPNQPINNTTVYNNYPTQPVNNTPIYNNTPQVYPPYVNISSPANNYSSQTNYVSVQGNIQNIQSANQMSISQNGYLVKYFSYDPYSGNFSFQTFLQQGTNNIIVTANSQYGTGSQGVTVFYNPPYTPVYGNTIYNNGGGNTNINNNVNNNGYINNNINNNVNNNVVTPENPTNYIPPRNTGNVMPIQLANKPIVQFTNPYHSPEDVFNESYNVSASVQNVTLANQITISINGNNVQQFNFNPAAKTVNFTANLLTGFNSINISATNAAGTDAKSTVIDYKPVGKPPRVEVFNPATSPFTSLQPNMIVSGYVYNVTSSSDIMVNSNGNILTFNYNNNTHEIDVPVNLLNGSNQVSIKATNAFGNDVKQLSLVYVNQGQIQQGLTTNTNTAIHGNNNNQIAQTFTETPHTGNFNNQPPRNYTGNQNTIIEQQTFTETPHAGNFSNQPPRNYTENPNTIGNNQIQQTYTETPHTGNFNNQPPRNYTGNQNGATTIETPPNTNTGSVTNGLIGAHTKPEITLTSPQTTPYTTMSGVVSISANLTYVNSSANVSVMYEGNQVSHSYNPNIGEALNFTSPLKPGMNTFVINATNGSGTATKTVDVNYVPTNSNGNVNGNPSLHFSGGLNSTANTPRGFTNTNIQQPAKTPNNQLQQPNQIQQPSNIGGRPRQR